MGAVLVRDPCGIVCLIATYAAVIYADYVVVRWIVLQTMHNSLWGALHAFLFNILVFLLAMAHLKAVCSDPGVVPLPHSRLDFSDMQPGGEQCSEGDGEWTVCTRINNCVGERNQKYFLQFLVYVGILAAYAIGLVVGSWIHECEDCSHEVSNKQSRILHSVLLVLESALFGLFVVAILVDQLSAILNDSTAVEQLQQTGPYRPGRTARALLSEVCGEGHPIFWLLPCQSREFASTPQSTSSYDV
ncbi:hypothetical protein B566_EDAN002561 [Ephemera danica]|nr:hypothetical protein B566_EDAN002561 [Ephemera danica]